jgi:hypothetical protein
LKKLVILIIPILLLCISGGSFAAVGDASFAFLRVAAGSRPASLAEAVTASAKDVTSAYYNPALLNVMTARNQAAFMYNSYFVDVTQSYLAFASKRTNYAVGGYLILGGTSGFEGRIQPSPEPDRTFDENNFVGAFTYARRVSSFDIGISLKYAYEKIDFESASSYMFDAGIYRYLTPELAIGGAVKNIGSEPKFINKSYPLSQEYRVGLSYRPAMFNKALTVLADGVFYSDLDPKYNFGAEYTYLQYFELRAGYGAGYDSRGMSFGGGVMYRQFKFDYAFVSYKNDLGNAHRFTLIASF